MNIMSIKIVHT